MSYCYCIFMHFCWKLELDDQIGKSSSLCFLPRDKHIQLDYAQSSVTVSEVMKEKEVLKLQVQRETRAVHILVK